MTEKKRQLVAEMSGLLWGEEKPVCLPKIDYLIEFGYLYERRKARGFSPAFQHKSS